MDDNNKLGGLDSADNPAFPDITSDLDPAFGSDPLGSTGSSFPDIGSGFSSDPLGGSGSSFPDIGSGLGSGLGSGFGSDPLDSTSAFPEIKTDDFAQISIDDTIAPPEFPAESAFPDVRKEDLTKPAAERTFPKPVAPAEPPSREVTYDTFMDKDDQIKPLGAEERDTFPDVTREPHDNGIADPVPPPPVTVMPSIEDAAKKPAAAPPPPAEEEDFAGDHYVWDGKKYVETDDAPHSYVPPHQQTYAQREYGQPEVSDRGGSAPRASSGQGTGSYTGIPEPSAFSAQVKNVKTMAVIGLLVTIFGCCAPLGVVLGIISLVKASGLKPNEDKLTPSEQDSLKSTKVLAIITLVFNAVAVLFEGSFFLLPFLTGFSGYFLML